MQGKNGETHLALVLLLSNANMQTKVHQKSNELYPKSRLAPEKFA